MVLMLQSMAFKFLGTLLAPMQPELLLIQIEPASVFPAQLIRLPIPLLVLTNFADRNIISGSFGYMIFDGYYVARRLHYERGRNGYPHSK